MVSKLIPHIYKLASKIPNYIVNVVNGGILKVEDSSSYLIQK